MASRPGGHDGQPSWSADPLGDQAYATPPGAESKSVRAATLSRRAGRNEALCALLSQLGWSISGFARRVSERCQTTGVSRSVSPSTVLRWCNGAVPGADLTSAACHVLSVALRRRVSPESLGWSSSSTDAAAEALQYGDLQHVVRVLPKLWQLDSQPGRAAVERMPIGGTFGSATHQALVMLPDAQLSGHGRRRIAAADVELLELQTDLYGRMDARYGGGRFRNVFAAFLDMQATPLLHGGFSARLGRRLYGSVADAAFALASMAYDDQLPGLAQRYDLQAMRLAQAVGDRGRLARAHIHQARLAASQGEHAETLTFARSAVLASAGAPAMVKTYAAITEARSWALNEDPELTLAAVARARDAFERAGRDATPRWLLWLDRPELESQAAGALAMAGLAQEGTEALRVAEQMPAERVRDGVELLVTAAELARLRGDGAERANCIARAVEAARSLKSRRIAARLGRVIEGQPLHDF